MRHLRLARPLVVFDLETTGTDPARDKIVEIALLRLTPDGQSLARTRRINPECPIPPEATAVHGITDEDVRDQPPFRRVARGLLELLEGADLAGFNVRRFDVPLLERELRDCGLDLGLAARHVVDALTIYHRKEPRDLAAAVRLYLGREHEGAHEAAADLQATVEVLDAQLARYTDLPRDVAELAAWSRPSDAVDEAGKFVRRGRRVLFAFGKHSGRALEEVAREERAYLEWIVGSDFPEDAKRLVREALDALGDT